MGRGSAGRVRRREEGGPHQGAEEDKAELVAHRHVAELDRLCRYPEGPLRDQGRHKVVGKDMDACGDAMSRLSQERRDLLEPPVE